MNMSDWFSIPFVETLDDGDAVRDVPRGRGAGGDPLRAMAWLGATKTTIFAPASVPARSWVATRFPGSFAPGR